VSDHHDDPGLDELERHLDAAFATTRPRRDFEDELWGRLASRGAGRHARGRSGWLPWAGVAGVAVLLSGVTVLLVVVVGSFALALRLHGGASGEAASSQSAPARSGSGAARATAPLRPGAIQALPGLLPAPAAAGVPEVVQDSGARSPLPVGRASLVFTGSSLPAVGPSASVYSYDPASGPADGTIVEVPAVPAGLRSADYPARQAGDGFTDAAAHAAGTATNLPAPPDIATFTAVRLVYVAVVSGGQGYLEPAYLFTGTLQGGGSTANVQVLVPALAAASLR
jgi:hypothetical protein